MFLLIKMIKRTAILAAVLMLVCLGMVTNNMPTTLTQYQFSVSENKTQSNVTSNLTENEKVCLDYLMQPPYYTNWREIRESL